MRAKKTTAPATSDQLPASETSDQLPASETSDASPASETSDASPASEAEPKDTLAFDPLALYDALADSGDITKAIDAIMTAEGAASTVTAAKVGLKAYSADRRVERAVGRVSQDTWTRTTRMRNDGEIAATDRRNSLRLSLATTAAVAAKAAAKVTALQ